MGQIRVGIIGCGLIGTKRFKAFREGQVPILCDLDLEAAKKLANCGESIECTSNSSLLISHPKVEAVCIATNNRDLYELGALALNAGKHVLLEKPGALNYQQLFALAELAKKSERLLRIGYNHRFHPAIQKAREIFSSGVAGELMFIRARYGHGGRLGYEKEWRADPKLSGGGELIDQGVHLIDLVQLFAGSGFSEIDGHLETCFWDMPVEDNAFVRLKTKSNKTAWLHASCSEWKNLFCFEIYGRTGKLQIDGLGGSYGLEKLTYYQMLPEMGVPETTVYEYPQADESWRLETERFISDIGAAKNLSENDEMLCSALETLRVVAEVYRAKRTE